MADGKCDYPACLQPLAPGFPQTPQQFCATHIAELRKLMLAQNQEALMKFWSVIAGGDEHLQRVTISASTLQSALTMQFIEDAAHMKRGAKVADDWDVT